MFLIFPIIHQEQVFDLTIITSNIIVKAVPHFKSVKLPEKLK